MGGEVRVILDGWWRVLHQTTEYFIIGKLNNPMVAIIEEILLAFSKFSMTFQAKIYAK